VIAAAPPITEQARDMDRVWDLFLWIATGVGAVVAGLLVYVLVRYRRRSDQLPRQLHEHLRIEGLYTFVPLVIVGALFGVTVVAVTDVEDSSRDPDLVVAVTAFQWQWRFDYPEQGVSVLGTPDATPELVLPADSTVRFEMTSSDVIHSFWIPGFRFKRDIFPGETTDFQVDVDDTTGFWESTGVCAEFCGLDHHRMQFSVRIVDADEFARWASRAAEGEPA
jgi:cytochrome c oxidase subunit II